MTLAAGGVEFDGLVPLVDGSPDEGARIDVEEAAGGWIITVVLPRGGRIGSIGLRLSARGVRRFLRSGYTSWDGSYFRDATEDDPTPVAGYAMTALLPAGPGAAVLGFLRHDRFQSRLTFRPGATFLIDVETLIDGADQPGEVRSEPIVLLGGSEVEPTLREWARRVAVASPLEPRLPSRRLTGWCSWYNLYASLSEPLLLEHQEAAAHFRDRKGAPFDVFLVDDGFTPEMGDWLETRPQFPHGMQPVLDAARDKGFVPGLWIAPFMVGNRSRLFAQHPDWVVRSRASGLPLAPMRFYGEFRWHKRSEEYYVLDVTHPDAEAYIRSVFRTWARDWGVGYFKTDFMHLGSFYGPDEARWHQDGLSRIAIWMRMARLIREEIGDALWLCCGSPLLPPIGLCDGMRIGRDVGVRWSGDQSAESLLRDQTTRNFMHGIFWQADPDCILLRDRFHELTDTQVQSLAAFAGRSGGVLMTSDQLDEVPEARRQLLADLAGDGQAFCCDFPELGNEPDAVLVQRTVHAGRAVLGLFNTGHTVAERQLGATRVALAPYETVLVPVQE